MADGSRSHLYFYIKFEVRHVTLLIKLAYQMRKMGQIGIDVLDSYSRKAERIKQPSLGRLHLQCIDPSLSLSLSIFLKPPDYFKFKVLLSCFNGSFRLFFSMISLFVPIPEKWIFFKSMK